MFTPSLASVLDVLKSKQYLIYENDAIDWNVNIVGIRNNSRDPSLFDDTLVVFHRFLGQWDIRYYLITTDPSIEYLLNPINYNGTAILKPGQYVSTYALDIHGAGRAGAHLALCQRLGEVTVYRDSDHDAMINMDNNNVETGMFGINIHRGPRNGQWATNNTYFSAGCQVFADDRKFDEFLMICQNAANSYGNKFTYTLLEQSDFI